MHWSDIIGASHSPDYSVWSYDELATSGVKEVCEYGWPRTLEGEIKQQVSRPAPGFFIRSAGRIIHLRKIFDDH